MSRVACVAAIAFGVFIAWTYAMLLLAPAVGTYLDDGVYVVTARALAEGHGYRIVSLPGEPAQTKYPVLFPWLLSLVWRVSPSFPGNVPLLKAVPLVAAIVWLWLARRLMLRLGATRTLSWVIVALVAASPWVAFLSTALMSETVFAALVTASLLEMTRLTDEPRGRSDGLAAGLLAGAATLTRSAGVTVGAACLLALALRRRWKACVWCTIGLAVFILPWACWVVLQGVAPPLDPYHTISNYGSWNVLGSYAWRDKLTVIAMNAAHVVFAPPKFWGLGSTVVPWLTPVTGVAGTVFVSRGVWRTRREPVGVVVVLYVAMLLLWVWPPQRFLVPLLPILAWLALAGAGRLKPVTAALAALFLMSGCHHLWGVSAESRKTGATSPVAGFAENWHELTCLLDWVASSSEREAVIVGNLDPLYYLYTGRKAVRAFSADPYLLYYNVTDRPDNPLGSAEKFRERLLRLKVDYLLAERGAAFEETPYLHAMIGQLSASHPGAVKRAAGSRSSDYAVYRIDRAQLGRCSTEPKGTRER